MELLASMKTHSVPEDIDVSSTRSASPQWRLALIQGIWRSPIIPQCDAMLVMLLMC